MKNYVSTKLVILLLLFFNTTVFSQIQKIKDSIINEEKFIEINGIEQWISIKGNSTKPIILFLHGGPGSPLSPYSETIYKKIEKEYLIVHWDQRGTGKTFGKIAPEELTPEFLKENPLSIELMTKDGLEIVNYVLKTLNKRKLILFGTSWGSLLGIKMIAKNPELFYAYVGHSQIVQAFIDDAFYKRIENIAKKRKDTDALNILKKIGNAPFERARDSGKFIKIIKTFEKLNTKAAPNNWYISTENYNSKIDEKNRNDGDDYSFINFVGDKKLEIKSMSENVDLIKENNIFEIPIYFIQGNEDILTSKESTKKYFHKIKSPKKKYYLVNKAGHEFNTTIIETQIRIFNKIKREIE